MKDRFANIVGHLVRIAREEHSLPIRRSALHSDPSAAERDSTAVADLCAAFLLRLSGEREAEASLRAAADSGRLAGAAGFFLKGLEGIRSEIETLSEQDQGFALRLRELSGWLSKGSEQQTGELRTEKFWSLFFPEAWSAGHDPEEQVIRLRQKRSVSITSLNPRPVTDPARQILFTSNVLMGLPPASASLQDLPLSDPLKERLRVVRESDQLYWYDHPVRIGGPLEENEVLHGLRGLEAALQFEKERGQVAPEARLTCLLSVSVTHTGLRDIAGTYLREEVSGQGGFRNLDIYLFTEEDTVRMAKDVLAPAAERYLGRLDATGHLAVFGVDGEYGRHYSFLKAVAPLWRLFVEPDLRGTFKIDLDQVFPQEELVRETGASALEHFRTPLWGARGVDHEGRALDLGMIAGALVNARDIGQSLFTPDVPFPAGEPSADEYVFFPTLPQALSTEAEMMTRYGGGELDGRTKCIQRVHVTGGTTGILVESLLRHRPFTPSFVGRAEDQAYLLSCVGGTRPRLAYVHKDGLIMRHDKEVFAREAIRSAYVAKLVGDYIRILIFSAYARAVEGDLDRVKGLLDPFTGCFITRIPLTVVYLRFALKALGLFAQGREQEGLEFVRTGARRITKTLDFVSGQGDALGRQVERERQGWNLYYDVLAALEGALKREDPFALGMRDRAQAIIRDCSIGPAG